VVQIQKTRTVAELLHSHIRHYVTVVGTGRLMWLVCGSEWNWRLWPGWSYCSNIGIYPTSLAGTML